MLPTCDDRRTHFIFPGRMVNDVQMANAKDLGEFLDLIRRRAACVPDGQWIRTASNWHELQLAAPRMPTRQELDSAATDNPGAGQVGRTQRPSEQHRPVPFRGHRADAPA